MAETNNIWDSYQYWTDDYLKRPEFVGTPITGKMLRNAAEQSYHKYGVYVPWDIALAQGQLETRFGTDASGRPNYRTNPFNVGEYDNGTKIIFPDTQSGVNAYYDLMARRYLKGKDRDKLLNNFVNDKGNRYASDPNYEKKLRGQINYINRRAKAKYSKLTEEK
jgi:flagellum-specific peptidoglycan hydrolase FlgJ